MCVGEQASKPMGAFVGEHKDFVAHGQKPAEADQDGKEVLPWFASSSV